MGIVIPKPPTSVVMPHLFVSRYHPSPIVAWLV